MTSVAFEGYVLPLASQTFFNSKGSISFLTGSKVTVSNFSKKMGALLRIYSVC